MTEYTFNVSGNICMQGPLDTDQVDRIIIKGEEGKDNTLKIVASNMQPCIGPKTNTNLSYGRWEPSGSFVLQQIIVDNAKVECIPSIPNFALGAVNYERVPEVICINGGIMISPEMEGYRKLVTKAEAPSGSTKISSIPEYYVQKEGESMFSSKQLEIVEMVEELGLDKEFYTDNLSPEQMKIMLRYQKFGVELSCVQLCEDKRNLSYFLNAVWHGVDPGDTELKKALGTMIYAGVIGEQQLWWLEVAEFLKRRTEFSYQRMRGGEYSDDELFLVIKDEVIKQYGVLENLEEDSKEVHYLYELIPPFQFFMRSTGNTKKQDVINYFREGHV